MKFSALCLDDILEDSPQTRFMVKMFEDDAEKVHTFAASMQSSLERLVSAQSESVLSLQQLSSLFQNYQQLNFQLERQENDYAVAMDKFGATVSEVLFKITALKWKLCNVFCFKLASWLELMLQQLQNCVLHPVRKLVNEFSLIEQQKSLYHELANDMDGLQIRLSRVNRKDSPKKIEDLSTEYGLTKKRFHKLVPVSIENRFIAVVKIMTILQYMSNKIRMISVTVSDCSSVLS
ncbi:unnamed protein product [Soboliphyme baturini]|uniref:Sec3_C domain-containing protein n=1 Tax=Soboliphyme baturini TaxID=241478 RepID=A0A183J5Y8_9BILA|nr:unnamed protein product [Soboliphyme baturini]